MRATVVDLAHCGRGEVARLIMCAAGLHFEDNRISLAEWNFVRHCEAQLCLAISFSQLWCGTVTHPIK